MWSAAKSYNVTQTTLEVASGLPNYDYNGLCVQYLYTPLGRHTLMHTSTFLES